MSTSRLIQAFAAGVAAALLAPGLPAKEIGGSWAGAESPLTTAAVQQPVAAAPGPREILFSPAGFLRDPASDTFIGPGDVALIRADGSHRLFLTEQQVRRALAINPGSPVNVDAVTRDPVGNLLLSFEDDVFLLGGTLLGDGGVVAIPAAALGGNREVVARVRPGSGVVLLSEHDVDQMVVRAMLSLGERPPVSGLGDVDRLATDPDGGSFPVRWEGGLHYFPNLLVGGDSLAAGEFVTTASGGRRHHGDPGRVRELVEVQVEAARELLGRRSSSAAGNDLLRQLTERLRRPQSVSNG